MPVGVFVPIKLEERLHARHARLEEAACGWPATPRRDARCCFPAHERQRVSPSRDGGRAESSPLRSLDAADSWPKSSLARVSSRRP